jgi:hypothetical protein
LTITGNTERRGEVEMSRKTLYAVVAAAGIAFAALAGGCSKKDFNREVVATVNGDDITVLELRELLGAPTGIFAFPDVPVEQKKRAVDQLVAGRLVVQAALAMGLGDTEEYKGTLRKNEIGVQVDALIRKEAGEKLKLDEKEIKAEAEKIKGENAGLSDAEAAGRASKAIIGRQLRKIQKDLVVTAREETGAAVDNAVLERIGKGESLPDSAVLASAGDEKILYGDVKKIIGEMPMLPIRPDQRTPEVTRALGGRTLEQELVLRSLKAYSKKRNIGGSEEYKTARRNMERAVVANMLFDNVTGGLPAVSDEEVAADYARRVQMMQGDKSKAPPIDAVREQLREVLKNQKRRAAFEEYIEGLRKKGKVTVHEELLPKV